MERHAPVRERRRAVSRKHQYSMPVPLEPSSPQSKLPGAPPVNARWAYATCACREATGQVRRAARGGALGTSSRDRTDQDVRLRARLCNSASRRRSSTGQSPHNSQRTLGLTHRCLLYDASFALKTSDDDRTGLERRREKRVGSRGTWACGVSRLTRTALTRTYTFV